jgi:hypothetical protein
MIWKDVDLLAQPQVMCCNREPQADKHTSKSAIYTAPLFGIYRGPDQRPGHGAIDFRSLRVGVVGMGREEMYVSKWW